MFYLGEGDIPREKLERAIQDRAAALAWGRGSKYAESEDHTFGEVIRAALETMNVRMGWRGRFSLRKKHGPVEAVLGNKAKDFYGCFDDVRKGRVSIVLAGPRLEHPFVLFADEQNYVVGASDASRDTIVYGYGMMEAWRADPRVHFFRGSGVDAFGMLFGSSLAYLITLYIGAGLPAAKEVQRVFDPEGVLQKSLEEMVKLSRKQVWQGSPGVQRKAAIALRGYMNAWFDFMEKSSWLEIHHTLIDTKVAEREQSFLDTATTEISETARGIILEELVKETFGAEEMERRERERREKQMDWTMFRIALGILYPREKEVVRSVWEKNRRRMTWKQLEETYYEEIWDLMRVHLSGQELEQKIAEKDRATLGRWHFIFELKKSERAREKMKTLEAMSLEEVFGRKNKMLSLLSWEGQGLPPDTRWDDAVRRFRKIMIRYHPDRAEITGVEPDEARKVSTEAIQNFRELEIIHDMYPDIFGIATLPADYFAESKQKRR